MLEEVPVKFSDHLLKQWWFLVCAGEGMTSNLSRVVYLFSRHFRDINIQYNKCSVHS